MKTTKRLYNTTQLHFLPIAVSLFIFFAHNDYISLLQSVAHIWSNWSISFSFQSSTSNAIFIVQ
jgi:hypothetical protein